MLKLDLNPKDSQLRQFAWVSLIGFPLIGWVLLHWRFGFSTTVAWSLTAVGALVFVLGMASTKAIKPLFVGLMLIAVPIGIALSTVVLGLLYYLLFTPVALLFKVMGRDKLNRRLDPQAATYWVERKTAIPAARYLRMY
ncbi:MAG: SxtJ family membrane protein [Planctomycetota bacterium]